ncbi:YbhB/YbcL family Raf kinase inhibitor-like protein [Flindersiella endophytica]
MIVPRLVLAAVVGALVAGLAACTSGGGEEVLGREGLRTFRMTSPAFAEGKAIPAKYSCDGANVSPPLTWSGVPAGTRSLILVVDDPDAPSGTYVHWILGGLAPSTRSLAENSVPAGAWQAPNSADDRAYTGPCPPSGTHHYRFTLYALSSQIASDVSRGETLARIGDAALASGRLTGTYQRR